MDYQKIIEKYIEKKNRKKATFVKLYYVDHLGIQEIMEQLYIDHRSMYHRLKQSVARDIAYRHGIESVDYQSLVREYSEHKNPKKSFFVKYFFILQRKKDRIISELFLSGEKEFFRLKESIMNDIARKKGFLTKKYLKNEKRLG